MNRRGFLAFLGAAAVAPIVPVPELDVGRRIFLPPRGGWMASGLIGRYSGFNVVELGDMMLTPAMISREALRILHDEITLVRDINRQYDPSFAAGQQWRRQAITIKLPRRYA